jgi:hypothetical protein
LLQKKNQAGSLCRVELAYAFRSVPSPFRKMNILTAGYLYKAKEMPVDCLRPGSAGIKVKRGWSQQLRLIAGTIRALVFAAYFE